MTTAARSLVDERPSAEKDSARREGRRVPKRGRLRPSSRRPPMLLRVVFLLGGLSVVTGTCAYEAATAREALLVAARDIAPGQVIAGADLESVDAAIDGAAAVLPVRDRDRVVGKVATRPIAARRFISSGDFVEPPGPGAGRVVVPVSLGGDRAPGELRVGDRVRVVDTGRRVGDDEVEPEVLAEDAFVFAVYREDSRLSERTVVDVNVEATVAPRVAASAAEGRIAFVLVERAA